jgi:diacylglycerol kinase family enzyme
MRALLVVNPVSTSASQRTREVLASALESDLKLEVAHTAYRAHGTELARQARLDGLDLVVALGGDGTVNEIVNGLLEDGPDEGVPALGVVPGGGTNVFARALGLPRDPVEATGAVLAAIRAGRRRSIGLGTAGDRWFTFNAGMGWDADVVARVDRRRVEQGSERPPRSSDYVRASVHQFFAGTDRRHPALTLHRPGAEPLEGVHMAIVANTAPWTSWGERPLRTSPEADFDHGLDVYALTRLGVVATLGEVQRLLRGRTSDRPRHVHRAHDLPELTLQASRPVAAQVDGEALGATDELVFRSVPDALRVLV